jgi:hypothetical protein
MNIKRFKLNVGQQSMEPWNQIIHTALLGTDKRQPDAMQWDDGLKEAATLIQTGVADKEEQFLQMAAVLFNYRQCGMLPLQKEAVGFEKACNEEKKYCTVHAMQVLRDILEINSHSLLRSWLTHCAAKNMIVTPDIVPALFNTAMQHKKLQNLAVACCGRRGEWLSRFNSDWNFSTADTDQQLWETGTSEQRKAVLLQLRQTDPAQAREWLQKTWPQEDANTKLDLLQLLPANIGEADIPFLESLSTEKSKKVKDAALKLLKQIPASSIVHQYQQALKQAVTIKKEKTFLGIGRQPSLQIQLPPNADELFKTGIEKLSSNKEISDEEFIAFQLTRSVPPSFWESMFESAPDKIIETLQKDKTGKKLLPAIVLSAVTFQDHRWAIAFMQHSDVFYLEIIPLLPVKQQEFYSIKFIGQHAESIINYAVQREDEWSHDLTKAILKHTAKNTYQYNRSFYDQHVHLLPVPIAGELEKFTPSEPYLMTLWSNVSEHIIKLLTLKLQTLKAFNE